MTTPSTGAQGQRPARQISRTPRQSVERAASIAQKYGYNGAAAHALSLMDANFRTGTVVVVGEIKRGKSSLVNALVGHRDLLPVDVLMCTSAPIRVMTDPNRTEAPEFRLVRGTRRDVITHEELPKWVTHQAIQEIDQSELGEDAALQLPSAAEIEVGFGGLGALTVIDTPGVGGLDEHAIQAALTEARQAGVLLMVCDASTPITKPEMDILRQAREVVGGVIVAVTKTDKNVRRWRSIVEDDRRLIAKHLGIEIPVIGVSSLRALDAVELDDPERRASVEERSGMAALRKQIKWELSAASGLGLRTSLDSIRLVLESIAKTVDEDIELHAGASDAVDKLEEQKRTLEQFREESSEFEQLFQRDIALARNEISGRVDRQLEQLVTDWTARINKDGMRILRTKPQVFTSQIEIELAAILENTLADILKAVESKAEPLFQQDPEAVRDIIVQVMNSLSPVEANSKEVGKKTDNLVDPSLVTLGMMGAGLASVATVAIAAPVFAGVWIGVNLGYRAMRNGKQNLLKWLREMQMTTRQTAMRMIDQVITTARTEISLRYRSSLRAQQKEIQRKIEEAKVIARESESERKEKVARLRKNLEIINATVAELTAQKRHLAQQSTNQPAAAADGQPVSGE